MEIVENTKLFMTVESSDNDRECVIHSTYEDSLGYLRSHYSLPDYEINELAESGYVDSCNGCRYSIEEVMFNK